MMEKLIEGKNPGLDYSIKTLTIATDINPEQERNVDILSDLICYLGEFGLTLGDVIFLDRNYLKQGNEHYRQFDEQYFEDSWNRINRTVDMELLKKYAVGNPSLLSAIESRRDLKKILWEEYQKIIAEEGSLHVSTEDEIATNFAAKYPDSHIFIVLFDHKVVAPELETRGELNYHFIGRGMYGYGNNCIDKQRKSKVSLPVHVVADQSDEIKKSFLKEMTNHEWFGHAFLGLKDHFNMPPNKCIMVPPRNKEELLECLVNYKGIYFCPDCTRVAYS